jgi:hypothetical protein
MYPCKRCGKLPEQHVQGKCLFENTDYFYAPDFGQEAEQRVGTEWCGLTSQMVCSRCRSPDPSGGHYLVDCMRALGQGLRALHVLKKAL